MNSAVSTYMCRCFWETLISWPCIKPVADALVLWRRRPSWAIRGEKKLVGRQRSKSVTNLIVHSPSPLLMLPILLNNWILDNSNFWRNKNPEWWRRDLHSSWLLTGSCYLYYLLTTTTLLLIDISIKLCHNGQNIHNHQSFTGSRHHSELSRTGVGRCFMRKGLPCCVLRCGWEDPCHALPTCVLRACNPFVTSQLQPGLAFNNRNHFFELL